MKKLSTLLLFILLCVGTFTGCTQAADSGVDSSSEAQVTDTTSADEIAAQDVVEATVLSVHDGSSISVLISGKEFEVAYLGIITPEEGQSYYEEATEVNREYVSGKKVLLERDTANTDRNGVLLRYVWAGDDMVNAVLVRNGYARADLHSNNTKYKDYFLTLENTASNERRGMWSDIGPLTGTAPVDKPQNEGPTVAADSSRTIFVEIPSAVTDEPAESIVQTPSGVSAIEETSVQNGVVEAYVTRVIDGDTIDVLMGGFLYRVRYIGMDTPEWYEPGYDEATRANAELVAGRSVLLEKDVSETDKFDRLLRYVWVDGIMVNAQLIADGFARVATYPPDVKYQQDFLKLQP